MPRVIDIKTGSPRHPVDSMQGHAYAKLAELNPHFITPDLKFDKSAHIYTVDGNKLVSVTDILKYFHYDHYKDKTAAQRGTYIHQLCQQFVEHGNINWSYNQSHFPEVIPYMSAFRDWYHDNDIGNESVLCEVPLASGYSNFAGTVDIILTEKTGIYNLYLKPNGKCDFICRNREKYWNWNLFSSLLNTYNYLFQGKQEVT